MATGYTETDIAKIALSLVGASRITSLDDDQTEPAIVCRIMYPIARDSIFCMAPWMPLLARARLAADSSAPAWGYAYRYALPTDCANPTRDIFSGEIRLIKGDFQVEGNYILTDKTGPIDIRYIKRVINPGDWDYLLVMTVAHYMAALIAPRLTQDKARLSQINQRFEEFATMAKAQNSRRNPGANLELVYSWEDARFNGSYPATYDPRLGGAYS